MFHYLTPISQGRIREAPGGASRRGRSTAPCPTRGAAAPVPPTHTPEEQAMTAAVSTPVDLADTDVKPAAARGSAGRGTEIDELVRAHLPLVGHLVREVLTRVPAHINRNDLVSAGMLALVLSARSYDAERGVPFGRFAAIRIRGAL